LGCEPHQNGFGPTGEATVLPQTHATPDLLVIIREGRNGDEERGREGRGRFGNGWKDGKGPEGREGGEGLDSRS